MMGKKGQAITLGNAPQIVLLLALTVLIFRSSQAWVFYQGAREEAA